MGAYLSKPKTEKLATDEISSDGNLSAGTCQMQGWRVTQEDAHICSLDFDAKTCLFGVFDGHGGAEVAVHCSKKFPDFLKNTEAYAAQDFEKALTDSFLGFDATLVQEKTIGELKELIVAQNEADNDDDDDDGLIATEGIDGFSLIEKLRSRSNALIAKGKNPLSPFIRARRNGSANEDGDEADDEKKLRDELSADEDEDGVSSSSANDKDQEPTSSANKEQDAATTNDDDVSKNGVTDPSPDISSTTNKSDMPAIEANGEAALEKETGESVSSTEESKDEGNDSASDTDEYDEEGEEGEDAEEEDDDDDDEELEEEESDDNVDPEDVNCQKFLKQMADAPGTSSGCTACVALIAGSELYVANAGDSRCVLSRKGIAVDLSVDHTPQLEGENSRIVKAGGRVTMDGRVNGGLNLSRAIGDHAYKTNKELKAEEQMISALPDINRITIGADDEFMVLACDGIWNSMTSQEVVDFVAKRIADHETKMSNICKELFEKCLAPDTFGDGTGCDNMTALIVQFKPSFAKESQQNKASVNVTTTTAAETAANKRRSSTSDNTDASTKRIKTDGEVDGNGIAETA